MWVELSIFALQWGNERLLRATEPLLRATVFPLL